MDFKEILEKMKELGITKKIFASENEDIYEDENENANIEIIREQFVSYHKQNNKKWRSPYLSENNEITVEGLGRIKVVEQKGGYSDLQEGATGMEWHIVRHFVDYDIYIKLSGYYTSYEGLDISSSRYKEVKPTERVIIEYK